MPQGRLWERWGLSLILLLGFLLAIVGWQSFEELKGFWPGLAKHIFEAIAIATFIGLTVEQFLKKQFAKEVFFASVGYVLPEELRPEMRWLCELDDFCTQDTMRCTLTPIGTNSVRFHVHRTQVLKNIGAGTHDVKVGLGIDEWFREESPSRIKKLTILQKGNTWPPGDQLRSEHIGKIDCGLNIAGGNLKITLQKDEDATIISEFEECYPRNGYFHMLIKYPERSQDNRSLSR